MPHCLEQAIVTFCGRLEYHHKLKNFEIRGDYHGLFVVALHCIASVLCLLGDVNNG
jgi:hypothetical protein